MAARDDGVVYGALNRQAIEAEWKSRFNERSNAKDYEAAAEEILQHEVNVAGPDTSPPKNHKEAAAVILWIVVESEL